MSTAPSPACAGERESQWYRMAKKHPHLPRGPQGSQMSQSPQEDGHRDGKETLPTVLGKPLHKTRKQRKGRELPGAWPPQRSAL